MRSVKTAAALMLLITTTACATITGGQNQSVSVTSKPRGASCELSNDKGKWFLDDTPATTQVSRSYDDLTVVCRKGDMKGSTSVKSSTKGLMFGNIIAGGIVGAAVDAGTGAGYDYPTQIHVPMR